MEATARHRNIPLSPRKARLVVDRVRGMKIEHALAVLDHLPQKTAPLLAKVIKAGRSNWEQKKGMTKKGTALYIKSVGVDGGKILKRIHPASKGRSHPLRKRRSHIWLTISEVSKVTPAVEKSS